jgi:hypothetical protein
MNRVFVCTNNKQQLGALVSRYTIERAAAQAGRAIQVEILNVDAMAWCRDLDRRTYRRGGKSVVFSANDLQSFTLSRFMPPQLAGYSGRAVVIDPDVFAVRDISPLFDTELKGAAIAARPRNGWETSVMLLECARLPHWKLDDFIRRLTTAEWDYDQLIKLGYEAAGTIQPLEPVWNSFDHLDGETRLLHNTNRRTQPWKTGLRKDFVVHKKPRPVFGLIPRVWVDFALGRQPHRYVAHPDPTQERFFLSTLADAIAAGAITREFVAAEIETHHVRRDLLTLVDRVAQERVPAAAAGPVR